MPARNCKLVLFVLVLILFIVVGAAVTQLFVTASFIKAGIIVLSGLGAIGGSGYLLRESLRHNEEVAKEAMRGIEEKGCLDKEAEDAFREYLKLNLPK